ncbi:DUF308 domain-containing protein [Proteiniclasticum sp.]|uniref:DUF308 domain-containing protein n=1 Tax=Proteiniclasticum sp. TaxID=2053595 RepID=UPI002898AAE1|nr:DUF308 domain-containing protein [Proteiniclasticum sp.]
MASNKDQFESEREKVTLGEDRFRELPRVEEENRKQNGQDEVIEVDRVIVDNEKIPDKKRPGRRWKSFGILAAIGLVLTIFSETIRAAVFRSEDSLLFVPKGGILIPPVGVILITLGTALVIIAFISLFNRRGRLTGQKKGIAILIGVLLIVFGVSTFFRYVDFRENTVTDRTLLTTRSYTYLDVTEVNASTIVEGEDNRLSYNYIFQNGRSYDIRVNETNMMEVRKIDTKIKGTARRSIDNYAIQEMERMKMYTKEEALNLFILE